jgi:rhodanese-related sulfurtransferase
VELNILESIITDSKTLLDSIEAEEVEKKEANTTKKDGILTTLFTNIGKFISGIITAIGNLFGVKAKDTDKSGVSATDVNAMKKHISEVVTMSNEFLASDDEEKRDTLLDKIKGKVAVIRANPKQAAKAAASGVAAGFGIVAGAKAIKGAVKGVKDAKANGVTDALKIDGGSVTIGMLKTALSGALDGLKSLLPKIEKDAEKNKNKPTLQAQSKKLADTIKSIAGKVGGIFKKVTGTFKFKKDSTDTNKKTTNDASGNKTNNEANNTTTTGGEGTKNESCLLSDNDEDFSTLLKLIF